MNRKGNHSTNYHHCALKEITNIMDTLEIVDIWRLKNPDLVRYTWIYILNQASRLDYFLVSFSLASKVKKVLMGDRMRLDPHLIGIHVTLIERLTREIHELIVQVDSNKTVLQRYKIS